MISVPAPAWRGGAVYRAVATGLPIGVFFAALAWLVLAVAAVLAVHDAAFGSVRDGVASVVYLGLIALEVFWWPRRQRQLLASADAASFASAAPTR